MADDTIIARAKLIWDEREKGFPRFTRQTFDQGTLAARMATLAQAKKELDNGG